MVAVLCSFFYMRVFTCVLLNVFSLCIRESPPLFENRIIASVYVRSITPSAMYQKDPFCSP